MKKCPNCHKLIPVGAAFCPDCGAKAGTYPADDASTIHFTQPASTASAPAQPASETRTKPRVNAPAKSGGAARAAAPRRKKPRSGGKPAGILIGIVVLAAVVVLIVLLAGKGCAGKAAVPALDSAAFGATTAAQDSAGAPSAAIVMPDVTGKSESEAFAALNAMGIPVRTEVGYDASLPLGTVHAQNPAAGTSLTAGEMVTLSVNATPLTFKVLQYAPRKARVTMGNLLEVCGAMNTTNPQFNYNILFQFPEQFTLPGAFRCLSGAGEATPVKLSGSASLVREGKNIGSIESVVAGDDYKVTVTSQADASQTVTRVYSPEDVKSIQLVGASFEGGTVAVDAPAAQTLTVRLTDDALESGYTNSAAPGALTPAWEVKICEGSYRWLSIALDGKHGEPLDGMALTVKQLYRKEANPKDKNPATIPGATYSLVNGAFVISIPLPEDSEQDVYAFRWIDVSLADGKSSARIKLLE